MISQKLEEIKSTIPIGVKLLVISKYQPILFIKEAYEAGQRDFGESYIQELREKQKALPKDISWHLIGKLQSNKIKYIAPFIDLIHSIEQLKQLQVLDKETSKYNRKIGCLLQIKISKDPNKSGLEPKKAKEVLDFLSLNPLPNVQVKGLMGMASYTSDENLIRNEFNYLANLFNNFKGIYKDFDLLSMGMSYDYKIAMKAGSNMIRIGTRIFGERKSF